MKIIVTGGAGFIGSSLVKRLAQKGSNEIIVIDNLWRGSIDNLRLSHNEYAIDIETNFFNTNLTDYSKCLELIHDVDVVYHLADIVGGIHFVFNNQQFLFRENILIDTNVISACLVNKIPNYIYVGTACSYPKHLQIQSGIVSLKENQTYPAEPESSYGWSKLMGEYQAQLVQETNSINVGLLRFHNVYGPGATYNPKYSQVIPSMIYKVIRLKNNPLKVWGSGDQYRDFVFIDDVVDALVAVFDRGMNKSLIQIGTEKATTIKELANIIMEIGNKDNEKIFEKSKPEGDRGRIANCERARDFLGWNPKIDICTGLERTYKWIEEQVSN